MKKAIFCAFFPQIFHKKKVIFFVLHWDRKIGNLIFSWKTKQNNKFQDFVQFDQAIEKLGEYSVEVFETFHERKIFCPCMCMENKKPLL